LNLGSKRKRTDDDYEENLMEILESMNKKVDDLAQELVNQETRRLQKELDCWHSNARTLYESETFKNKLVDYYQRRGRNNSINCMVMNTFYPANEETSSYIVKKSTQGDTMESFGLFHSQIDSERNGLLLLEPIKQAFDRKDLCFLYNPIDRKLTVKVLNPDLLSFEICLTQPVCYSNKIIYK
jgi:hypothetical protein